ncbi:hypothetical protein [Virgibacillus sp. DJP39]|uniref:hypothetical protein n=1 Tax=Virgibacillus sp. DJP39 TaxID=3409790 RepID=UPI003BB53DE3
MNSLTWLVLIAFLHTNGSFLGTEYELVDSWYVDNFEVYEIKEKDESVENENNFPKDVIVESLEYLNSEIDVVFDEPIPIVLVNKKYIKTDNEGKKETRLGEVKNGIVFIFRDDYKRWIYKDENNKERLLKSNYNKTLLHEVGHILQSELLNNKVINKYKKERIKVETELEEKKLKVIENNQYMDWGLRPDEVFSEDFSALFSKRKWRLSYNQTKYPYLTRQKANYWKEKIIKYLRENYERNDNDETTICAKRRIYQGFLEK